MVCTSGNWESQVITNRGENSYSGDYSCQVTLYLSHFLSEELGVCNFYKLRISNV